MVKDLDNRAKRKKSRLYYIYTTIAMTFFRLFIFFFVFAQSLHAQDATLKGKVTDAGKEIPQAQIYLKSYKETGTQTGADGTFTLTLPAKLKDAKTLQGTIVLPSGIRHSWTVANEVGKFLNLDIKESKEKAKRKLKETEEQAKALEENLPAQTVPKEDAKAQEKEDNKELKKIESKKYKESFVPEKSDLAIHSDIQNLTARLLKEQEMTTENTQAIQAEIQRITQKLKDNPDMPEPEKEKIREQIRELEAQLKKNLEAYQKLKETTERELVMLKRLANMQEDFLQRNQYLLWGSAVVSLVLLIVSLFYFFISRQQMKRNEHLKKLLEKIEEQQEELRATNDVIAYQKNEIEKNINDAKIIQKAMLPSKDDLANAFGKNNYFVLYKPHSENEDWVSGDFYWVEEKEDKLYFVCADCTGHGISGALVSMLGSELLHEVVHNQNHHEPDEILKQLHAEMRRALHYDVTNATAGMDASLVIFHKTKDQPKDILQITHLTYSGAKNDVYVVPKGEETTTKDFIASRYGIAGKDERERIFDKDSLQMANQEVTVYFWTDGYQDQFGGEKNKKMGKKGLQKILLDNTKEAMANQKETLWQTHLDWKSASPDPHQIDDITVIGIKVKFV